MKKQTILLITLLIISTGFLSGCNENGDDNKIDLTKLELVDYTVEIRDDLTGEEFRQITGNISNNAGKGFEMIKIEVTFYDINNNLLHTKESYIKDIANKETKEFSTIYHSFTNYYYQVDWNNIKFNVSVFKD
jgi:hypothetical protein